MDGEGVNKTRASFPWAGQSRDSLMKSANTISCPTALTMGSNLHRLHNCQDPECDTFAVRWRPFCCKCTDGWRNFLLLSRSPQCPLPKSCKIATETEVGQTPSYQTLHRGLILRVQISRISRVGSVFNRFIQKRSVYIHAIRPLLEDILRLGEQRTAFATKCRLVPLKLLSFFLPSRNPDVLSHGTRYNGGPDLIARRGHRTLSSTAP